MCPVQKGRQGNQMATIVVHACMFADLLSLGCKLEFTSANVLDCRKMLAWSTLHNTITSDFKITRTSGRIRKPPEELHNPSRPRNPSRPASELRNPPPSFEDCMSFQVICRDDEGCLLVRDSRKTPSLESSSIVHWTVSVSYTHLRAHETAM